MIYECPSRTCIPRSGAARSFVCTVSVCSNTTDTITTDRTVYYSYRGNCTVCYYYGNCTVYYSYGDNCSTGVPHGGPRSGPLQHPDKPYINTDSILSVNFAIPVAKASR